MLARSLNIRYNAHSNGEPNMSNNDLEPKAEAARKGVLAWVVAHPQTMVIIALVIFAAWILL